METEAGGLPGTKYPGDPHGGRGRQRGEEKVELWLSQSYWGFEAGMTLQRSLD